jgi:hypothetical protein
MATGITANYSLPYPKTTDPVNVASDIEDLANRIDADLSEIIQDTSSSMITGGTNVGISTSYNDATGKLSLSIIENGHNHIISNVDSLQDALDLKSPINSPSLTGIPLSTTASVDTDTTQIATTAYVIGQSYAKLANPDLTGIPTAPTAAALTNTTQIATTSFVTSAFGSLIGGASIAATEPTPGVDGSLYLNSTDFTLNISFGGGWLQVGSIPSVSGGDSAQTSVGIFDGGISTTTTFTQTINGGESLSAGIIA